MAAVRFTKIPCKPNTGHKAQRKPIFFTIFVLVLKTMSSLGLKNL